MKLPLYQIDAFADALFKGNPAAVVPLPHWLPDQTLQAIAAENNLSETAFLVKEEQGWHIRWFTPTVEVDLCGHATLATAHYLFHHEQWAESAIAFQSRSGRLAVSQSEYGIQLDFPADVLASAVPPAGLMEGMGQEPLSVWRGKTDYLLEYPDEATIVGLSPDLRLLKGVEARGIIATAPGDQVDVVSRFFAPAAGVDEDPVTGSAHTSLTPFWAQRLGKDQLVAQQLSARGGTVHCTLKGDRVYLAGKAITYLEGTIQV